MRTPPSPRRSSAAPPPPTCRRRRRRCGAFDGVTRTGRFSFTTAELVGPTIPGGHLAVFGYVSIDPDGLAMVGRFRVVDGRLAGPGSGRRAHDRRGAGARRGPLGRLARRLARLHAASRSSRTPPRGRRACRWTRRSSASCGGPTDLRDAQERQRQPNDYVTHQQIYLTAGFWEAADGDIASLNPFVAFDVEDGTDLPALLAAADRGDRRLRGGPRTVPRARRHLQRGRAQRQPPLAGPAGLRRRPRPGRALPGGPDPRPPDRPRGPRQPHPPRPRPDAAPAAAGGGPAGGAGGRRRSGARRDRRRRAVPAGAAAGDGRAGGRSCTPACRSTSRCSSAARCWRPSSPCWPAPCRPREPWPRRWTIGDGRDRPEPRLPVGRSGPVGAGDDRRSLRARARSRAHRRAGPHRHRHRRRPPSPSSSPPSPSPRRCPGHASTRGGTA